MDLRCPHCHKHVFPMRSVFMLGEHGRYSQFNVPMKCPRCGGYCKFPALRQTLIDLITLAACGLVIVFMVLFTHGDDSVALWATALAIGAGLIARYFAIKMLAILAPVDYAP